MNTSSSCRLAITTDASEDGPWRDPRGDGRALCLRGQQFNHGRPLCGRLAAVRTFVDQVESVYDSSESQFTSWARRRTSVRGGPGSRWRVSYDVGYRRTNLETFPRERLWERTGHHRASVEDCASAKTGSEAATTDADWVRRRVAGGRYAGVDRGSRPWAAGEVRAGTGSHPWAADRWRGRCPASGDKMSDDVAR